MSWFLFSLLSVFALATAELTQQYLLNKKNAFSEKTSAVLTFLFQSILTIPFILFSSYRNEIFAILEFNLFFKILAVTSIAALASVFYLRSFKVKNISISLIFVSGSAIVSTFLGITFFLETTYFLKFLGIFLILFAIVVINIKNIHLERNHFYGLLAGFMFGICYTLDKSIVQNINPLIYIFWTFFIVSFWVYIFNANHVISSVREKSFSAFTPIMISACAYFLYNFFTFTAYTYGGEVGRIDAINNSQIFLIILFEYFILKHTHSLVRKVTTALIAFIGIMILGFY